MIDKINERLNIALSNLDKENFEEIFPLLLDDLEYILVGLNNDFDKLSLDQQFEYGILFEEKNLTYFSKLAKIYFKMRFEIDIDVVPDDDYNLSMAGGGYNALNDTIYYSPFGVAMSRKSDLSFLHTCLHEVQHKMQHSVYICDELLSFPPYMLKVLKENLLVGSMQDNNREFYVTNYDLLFAENDAEIFAKNEIYNFINNMLQMYVDKTNKSSKGMYELLVKVNKMNELFVNILSKESFRINSNIESQIYSGDLVSGDYKISGKFVDRLITLDKYIKSNPHLQEQYPILRLLFNGNESKSYEELMIDKEIFKTGRSFEGQQRVDELYREIVALDPILTLTDKLEKDDIEFVRAYLALHPTIISEYSEEINQLNEKYGNMNFKSR